MCITVTRTNHHIHFPCSNISKQEGEKRSQLAADSLRHFNFDKVYEMKTRKTSSLWSSRRGIAIPVTFLMLFVSLTILITATYYFSISRINAKSQELKAAGVEQEMLSLEKVVRFVAWSPGTYETFEFGDFGGTLKVLPASKSVDVEPD